METLALAHASAAGISISAENKQALNEWLNNKLKNVDSSKRFYVDFVFDASNPSDIEAMGECLIQIDQLNEEGLWGQDMSEPYIAIKNVEVGQNIQLMGKDQSTLKISYKGVDFMKFKTGSEEYDELRSAFGSNTMTFIGRANMNAWGGKKTPQLFIEEYSIDKSVEYAF